MRLDDWTAVAPSQACLGDDVLATLTPVLEALGAEPNPDCWVLWGEDYEIRYAMLVATAAGLIIVSVRLARGLEGPRVTGKLIRWSKLTVGEISLESSGGRHIVAVQVENLLLKGTDDEADRICEFCVGLLAGIDGRAFAPAAYVAAGVSAPVAQAEPATGSVAPRKQPLRALPAPTPERQTPLAPERQTPPAAIDRRALAAGVARGSNGQAAPGVPPRSVGASPAEPATLAARPPVPARTRQPAPERAPAWQVPTAKPAPKKEPTRTWRP